MHTSHVFGGSDDDQQRFLRLSPPTNEIGAPVDLSVELLRTPDLAVYLLGGQAYSTGVHLRLVVRVRPGSLSPDDARRWTGSMMHSEILIGFELADGTVVSNGGDGPWGPDGDGRAEDEPLLVSMGAGSDLTSIEQDVWLTPVPPPGRILCVVEHADSGIPETQVELDASPIVDASRRAVVLWPWEPEPDLHDVVHGRALDPGGWFGRNAGAQSDDHDG